MLELDEGKPSRPVLRAGGGSNPASLTRRRLVLGTFMWFFSEKSTESDRNSTTEKSVVFSFIECILTTVTACAIVGYTLKAGQLTYDCRYSTMHGMPVTGGHGFRGLKPLWYNGVPP